MAKRIALYISALRKGGAERVLVNLADYLAENGYQVTMVTQYQKENEYPLNPKVKRVISDISGEEVTKSRILNFVRRFRKLKGIWKREKPEVILSFIGKNNILAILTSLGLVSAVAVSVRSEPAREYYNKWMRFMARNLFYAADGVILQTKECFSFFPKRIRKKAVILRNPINTAFFKKRYEGERDKTIVTVGRVDENKNHRMLIQAFAGLTEEFPDYKLIIYGDGEQRKPLLKLVEQMDLQERVLLPGNVENVPEMIYKAGVFVLSSNKEGMPNALIEAMIMGLTVVSTNCPCGGPAELIDHGVNGLLTPVGDVKKMKDNLQILLNDLQKSEELGRNAAKTGDIYRPEKVYKEWENYLNLLAERKNRR